MPTADTYQRPKLKTETRYRNTVLWMGSWQFCIIINISKLYFYPLRKCQEKTSQKRAKREPKTIISMFVFASGSKFDVGERKQILNETSQIFIQSYISPNSLDLKKNVMCPITRCILHIDQLPKTLLIYKENI